MLSLTCFQTIEDGTCSAYISLFCLVGTTVVGEDEAGLFLYMIFGGNQDIRTRPQSAKPNELEALCLILPRLSVVSNSFLYRVKGLF